MSSVLDSGAAALLTRAVQLDNEGRYQESLSCYQSGIEQLLQVVKGSSFNVPSSLKLKSLVHGDWQWQPFGE